MRKVSRWTSSDESMPGYRTEIIPNLATARGPKDENSTAQKQLSRLLPGWGTSAGPDEMSQPRTNQPTNQHGHVQCYARENRAAREPAPWAWRPGYKNTIEAT
ncbi:hypothetical protein H0G86_001313 [Trichoderma simmonsii]|uniref:Uncharacterized protein n=1 Tax=Trichoderma simmonsii TaxID=1491479 RepID=A0A8G0L602_9HYPO|nr:hypothetical protein H0G86_001313 [Trichoderma simmonsii]